MIKIPATELTNEALLGVIDAFILREGTDYGHQEFTLDEKRDRVRAMLQKRRCRDPFLSGKRTY